MFEQSVAITWISFVCSGKEYASPQVIDLHGLRPHEAVVAVKDFIARKCEPQTLQIITGKGLHSVGGRPKVKLAIIDLLFRLGLDFKEAPNNAGKLLVYI